MAQDAVATTPSGVGERQATLNGHVNPDGIDSNAYFEYGHTTSYGAQTAPVSVGAGSSDVPVQETIVGLTPSSTYHYRVVLTGGTPPPPGLLPWAPPALTTPTTISPPASGGPSRYDLTPGQDYIIDMPGSPMIHDRAGFPVLKLVGGRNVVIIGGEIRIDNIVPPGHSVADAQCIHVENQTGVVHLEGLYLHGAGCGQGVLMNYGSTSAHPRVQMQNCRIETLHPITTPDVVHPDGVQSEQGPYEFWVYNYTCASAGTILQLQPHNLAGGTPIGTWNLENINGWQVSNKGYALWKACDVKWPTFQGECWVKNLGNLAWANGDGSIPGGGIQGWTPGNSIGWPVTGSAWNIGLRPSGDFVPSGVAGIGYVSPGYV